MVGQLEGGEIGRFQEALVQADYERTAARFVGLLKEGRRMPDLVRYGVDAAAPYLTVPSHVMITKRTTALDCVRVYEDRLGLGQSVIFTPNGQQHDIRVMGLTLTKPVDND
jgi:hypothetical protein